jgi:hypothetical protein
MGGVVSERIAAGLTKHRSTARGHTIIIPEDVLKP